MKHKKDIIGGQYNCLISDTNGMIGTKPSAFTLIPENRHISEAVHVTPKTRHQSVMGLGTGYMMVRRKVFMTMPQPWFEFRWLDKEHSNFEGEDMYFCKKANELGFKLWCDTDCFAAHSKEILI